eukprot:TRINITY_DN3946_c0_g1_i1.p1 TRINITY_DN3946_c0_g1~~TRINITY_DN3946_c0_g1_i1.p1  ORF type:complete len:764 (-),score=93.75 TRINITY_DN3946_c0_g1_i1:188-2479(-)
MELLIRQRLSAPRLLGLVVLMGILVLYPMWLSMRSTDPHEDNEERMRMRLRIESLKLQNAELAKKLDEYKLIEKLSTLLEDVQQRNNDALSVSVKKGEELFRSIDEESRMCREQLRDYTKMMSRAIKLTENKNASTPNLKCDCDRDIFSYTEGIPNGYQMIFPLYLADCEKSIIEFRPLNNAPENVTKDFFEVRVFEDPDEFGSLPLNIELNPIGYPKGGAIAIFYPHKSPDPRGWYIKATAGNYSRMERISFVSMPNAIECPPIPLNLPPATSYNMHIRRDNETIRIGEGRSITVKKGENVEIVITSMFIADPLIQSANFMSRIESDSTLVPVDCAPYLYSEELKGWSCSFVVHDPGEYKLKVSLNSYYGHSEPLIVGRKPSISIGSHQQSRYKLSTEQRSQIFGSPFRLIVKPSATKGTTNTVRCSSRYNQWDPNYFPKQGRWKYLPESDSCVKPICSASNRTASRTTLDCRDPNMNFEWVWVPYDCYYHLFTPEELLFCAKKTGIKWIHVMGDSTSREVIASMLSMFPVGDISYNEIYETLRDAQTSLQLSYEVFQRITEDGTLEFNEFKPDQIQLDRFNLRRSDASVKYPDYFIFHPGMIFRAMKLPTYEFEKYAAQLADYIDEAVRNGQKVIYYAPPFIYSQAHRAAFAVHESAITEQRVRKFDKILQGYFETIRSRIASDNSYKGELHIFLTNWPMSAIPFGSLDGVHYLWAIRKSVRETEKGRVKTGDHWRGGVSTMMTHSLLNLIFKDCPILNQP